MASGPDQLLNFGHGQNVRQCFDPGRLDDIDPVPVLLEYMLPEKLQAIAVSLDGTPGVGIDQLGEIHLELLHAEPVRTAAVVSGDAPYGSRVDIDSALAKALQFEGPEVALIEAIEALLLGRFHGRLLAIRAPNGPAKS